MKQIRDTDIALWLAACEKAGLVRCYNAFNSRNKTRGEPYVAVLNFLNRKKRIKSEHPPPEGQIPLLSGVEEKRREEKTTRAWTVEKEFPEANVPTWPEVKTYAEMHGVPEKCALSFFEHHHNNNLWCNQFDRLIKWQSKLVSWSNNDRQQKGNYAGRNIGKNNSQSANRNTGTLNEGTADQYRGVGRVVPISDV